MALINVYSRAPISHKFEIIENGICNEYVIKGMNTHQVIVEPEFGSKKDVPRITQLDEKVFEAIAKKYESHTYLFGGNDTIGRKLDPLIYKAKSVEESKKMMDDFKPAISEREMITKTKGIEEFKSK